MVSAFLVKCVGAATATLYGFLSGSVWAPALALIALLCADAWALLSLSPRVPTEMERLKAQAQYLRPVLSPPP